ncbi:S-adenosyl-L-methionine-dependent methyltransferase [Camillea tinctor]|nr:S-adenosyl-L-methionine-dependent methyltransferase [Camillea tinctor]
MSSSSPPSLYDRTVAAASGLIDPWIFMSLSLSYAPRAAHTILTQRLSPPTSDSDSDSAALPPLSWSRFRDVWFMHFWSFAGPGVREGAEPSVLPLLEGRPLDAAQPVAPPVGGVVLELGAGSGFWVDVWRRPGVQRVYGVEPNPDQHAALRRAVRRAGLEDVYEIVPVGIEDLQGAKGKKWEGGIEKGSVDCIVSILCLCSIPDPEANIKELYSYLKPGGRWYAYEHVRAEYSWYMRLYQRFLNLFWPHLIGGCLLCRPTEKTLREAGPWSRIDVGQPPAEQWFHCVPHIAGVFTK